MGLKKLNSTAVIMVLLLFMIQLKAQPVTTWTLEKSVAYALENNPEIAIAEKEVEKSRAAVGEAYSNILPQLDASANYQHSWKIQKSTIPNFIKTMMGPAASPDMPDVVQIAFGLENTFTYGAKVSQPLFLGWAGIAGIQAANAAEKAAKQNLNSQRQSLIYQTANAFYSCMMAREVVEVQEEALRQAEANFSVVQKKYDAGSASGFDKMRAEVELANLRPDVISARNNYRAALTRLRNILGLEKEQQIEIAGEFYFSEDEFAALSLKELQDIALEERPEIKAMNRQKEISEKSVTIARSAFLPKLFFQTEYSSMAMRNDLNVGSNDFSEGITSSLSLQIPLFHGFRSSKQYQKAKLDYRITLDSEKQVEDGIAAEVEVASNKFKETRQKYFSARETVALAEEALRLANLMYDEGANTQLDVINSQLALTRARLNRVSSIYEYEVARYNLRRVTGRLDGVL